MLFEQNRLWVLFPLVGKLTFQWITSLRSGSSPCQPIITTIIQLFRCQLSISIQRNTAMTVTVMNSSERKNVLQLNITTPSPGSCVFHCSSSPSSGLLCKQNQHLALWLCHFCNDCHTVHHYSQSHLILVYNRTGTTRSRLRSASLNRFTQSWALYVPHGTSGPLVVPDHPCEVNGKLGFTCK